MEIEKIENKFNLRELDGDELMSLQSMMLHYSENIKDKEVVRKWRHLLMKIDNLLKT